MLLGPAWGLAAWQEWPHAGTRRTATVVLVSLVPLASWTLFSVISFGFPFPNTAYAKLTTGVAPGELAAQGWQYLLDFAHRDPAGTGLLAAGIALGLCRRASLGLSLGLLAYAAYVVRIGGDFMSGRFLMVPVVAAVLVLARTVTASGLAVAGACAVTVLTAALPWAAARVAATGTAAGQPWRSGIADEKAFYYPATSLRTWWARRRDEPFPQHGYADTGMALRATPGATRVLINIGVTGYVAPLDTRIIDVLALSEPLLARLPAGRPWRIGHFWRHVPDGYEDSVRSGENRVVDARIRAYYDDVRLVTQGPLFTSARWRAIARLNVGPRPAVRWEPSSYISGTYK